MGGHGISAKADTPAARTPLPLDAAPGLVRATTRRASATDAALAANLLGAGTPPHTSRSLRGTGPLQLALLREPPVFLEECPERPRHRLPLLLRHSATEPVRMPDPSDFPPDVDMLLGDLTIPITASLRHLLRLLWFVGATTAGTISALRTFRTMRSRIWGNVGPPRSGTRIDYRGCIRSGRVWSVHSHGLM